MNRPSFLYFVTPEVGPDIKGWLRLVEQAVLGGVDMVQVRDKVSPDDWVIEAARQLKPLFRRYRVPLIINDRIEVALAIGADGLHVGQSDMHCSKVRKRMGSSAIVGVSLGDIQQLDQVKDVDYIAASPVFATKTKVDAASPWGLEGLWALRSKTHLPIIAIGGINADNITEVLQAGADGVAVVSAIAEAPCPRRAAQIMREGFRGGVGCPFVGVTLNKDLGKKSAVPL